MKIKENEKLSEYTTLKIGGPAKYLVEIGSADDVKEALNKAKNENLNLFVLGNGSNVLFEDEGFDGMILHLGKDFSKIETSADTEITAQAGATNEEMAVFAKEAGLSGYEFACGVPGTVGGAVFMNAGCYGGEIKDILKSVTYMDENENVQTKDAKDLDLAYRHSWFSDHPGIILEATFALKKEEPETIQKAMDELQEKRYAKQPMDKASCGSTFKRPEGHFAAALIDEAGLRGYRVGDAMVSTKHTGFLINDGQASAKEFNTLIEDVIQKVKDHSGVTLECEVKKVKHNGK